MIFCLLAAGFPLSGRAAVDTLYYPGKALAGLVGNGAYLVRTLPASFEAVRGAAWKGELRLQTQSGPLDPGSLAWHSTFFPGGVLYSAAVAADTIRLLYGVLPQSGYTIGVETPPGMEGEISLASGRPFVRTPVPEAGAKTTVFYAEKQGETPASLRAMQHALYAPYAGRLVLESPDTLLNKAVVFSQYLLDLSDNGRIMLCELFRWLDIWARDLGSGLLPGALASGREEMARRSLQYDLDRYAAMNPSDCKNSNDPSQGGTASGIGWTARSIWKYYLYSGDRAVLERDAEVIRPWVAHWIQRDYDGDGLVIDVTEFMDHMIMMLTTNGVTTLAANAMYAGLLHNFSLIENELGNREAAARLQGLYERTRNAVNATYWNEEEGYFNNMMLWQMVSRRSSQASQSMLLKIGATDHERARRTLDYLKRNNWNPYGSITIVPRMNHVSLANDQNMKVWPWWNLWEAEARFRYGDQAGGYRLLQNAAATVREEKYPGLLEETLDLDGTTYGGNAFPTGAGNLLDVVTKDLLGVEPLEAGWKQVKIVPAVPQEWTDYRCTLPSPGGTIRLVCRGGKLEVDVADPAVQVVYTTSGTRVRGARKQIYEAPAEPRPTYRQPEKKAVPPLPEGKTVLFYDPAFHSALPDLPLETIDVRQLGRLDRKQYARVVVAGSRLPLCTPEGESIPRSVERFVSQGGTLVLYGAEANAKCDEDGAGILGEQGGLIDWYQWLPARRKYDFEPGRTDTLPGKGNLLYRSAVKLPDSCRGKPLYLEIGALLGLDSVFVNGVLVGNYRDMTPHMKQAYPTRTSYPHNHTYKRVSRMYVVLPEDSAYGAFRFGGRNELEIRISRDALGEGLTARNRLSIGILASGHAWQAVDEDLPDMGFEFPKRKGVNYWGKEQFFNSWSTQNGLFGFAVEGCGVEFADSLRFAGLSDPGLGVQAAYTDFALFEPWLFEPLAYTVTSQGLLYPMKQERYPCIVRIVDSRSGGGFLVVAPSVAENALGKKVLERLKTGFLK